MIFARREPRPKRPFLSAYTTALGVTALGLVLVILAAIASGRIILALDIGARMIFALLVMLVPWPWLGIKRLLPKRS